MAPEDVLSELQAEIRDGMSLAECITIFVDHYEGTDVDGCDKENDGDLLLFQWGGPYPWDDHFTVNVTRQFSYDDENGEYEGMKQLGMTCQFDPELVSCESGNFWLSFGDTDGFKAKALSSPPTSAVRGVPMKSIAWTLGDV